jgi:hypothetical protein
MDKYECKNGLNLRNVCYHSVQISLSSQPLFGSLKIELYNTVVLPVVLYG